MICMMRVIKGLPASCLVATVVDAGVTHTLRTVGLRVASCVRQGSRVA